MHYNTVFVGMDVHKETFSLCCYTIEDDKYSHHIKIGADYKLVLSYLAQMRSVFGEDTTFLCGYEAGCLGFTLYHQLTDNNVNCIILAPSTMEKPAGRKIKTDKRDAELIAKCLATHGYKSVHVPTEEDEQVKDFIRMRDDHRLSLKKIKQQILAFCLRHGFHYDGKSKWTMAHLKWLKALEPDGLYKEILSEYIVTYEYLTDKIERLDKRIDELASRDTYKEEVHRLTCFLGVKTVTALATIVEVSDFKRFAKAPHFASYLGLVPGESTSADNQNRLCITKAGNTHVRRLLIEAAQSYSRGQVGHKSKELKARQSGNSPEVIAYADKANERLRRKYFTLVLRHGKNSNTAKTAIARELACFMWGMLTENYA